MVTGVILTITLLGSFEFVVRPATFAILLCYSITNLAAMKQPPVQQLYRRAISWLGLADCLAMSVSLPRDVIVSGVILLAAGFGVRWLVKKT